MCFILNLYFKNMVNVREFIVSVHHSSNKLCSLFSISIQYVNKTISSIQKVCCLYINKPETAEGLHSRESCDHILNAWSVKQGHSSTRYENTALIKMPFWRTSSFTASKHSSYPSKI